MVDGMNGLNETCGNARGWNAGDDRRRAHAEARADRMVRRFGRRIGRAMMAMAGRGRHGRGRRVVRTMRRRVDIRLRAEKQQDGRKSGGYSAQRQHERNIRQTGGERNSSRAETAMFRSELRL